MWPWLFSLLCLAPLGSGTPLRTLRSLAPSENGSSPGVQSPGVSSVAPAVTPTLPPATSSDAPALSLNLGLNFKIKVRSQGKGRPGEGGGGASAKPGPPTTRTTAPGSPKALEGRSWPEGPAGGSGWLGPGVAEDPPSSGPGTWPWERSPGPGPTPRPPLTLWPKLLEKGSVVPSGGEDEDEDGRGKELEFKIDIDLTAGLGREGPPNGSSGGGGGVSRRYPLFPGLSVGMSEIASKLGAPGLFGATLAPPMQERPDWNGTGGSPTPEWVSGPGPESSSLAASPGGEGAFAALPGCLPDHPEDCGSPLPEPGSPALSSLLLPAVPLFVPLHSDWNTAQAEWGLAWEAQVYGAGSLFALVALLSLAALLALPCRCPAGCWLLALLHLLLAGAGGARALLLFGDARGQLELFPDFAVRLLHDLALPCLTSALAVALLLLSLRSRAKASARAAAGAGLRHPCLLAVLLLLHFSVAAGAVLAADLLNRLPFLLLAARGLFALLATLLSSALLVFYCLARGDAAAQVYDLKATATPAGRCPFSDTHRWRRAARAAALAACFGLLSAGLHTYALLHALGYGLSPELFGPWPWWALQLACRLCEAGIGLPLACLGLCPLCRSPSEPWCRCRVGLSPERSGPAAAKAPLLPNDFQWALSRHEKLVVCDTITRSESDCFPLCALPPETEALPAAPDPSDPTADFCPPSPIDLRRSIDEALCGEGLFREAGALCAPRSTFSLSLARGPSSLGSGLSRAASCVELVPGPARAARDDDDDDDGEASPESSAPDTTLSSPGPWRVGSTASASSAGSTASCSPCERSTEDSSLALCSDPGRSGASGMPGLPGSPPRSPPPPGHRYWALTPVSQESPASVGQPGAETALLQKEFMDVCRQIDTLSVGSETIDL